MLNILVLMSLMFIILLMYTFETVRICKHDVQMADNKHRFVCLEHLRLKLNNCVLTRRKRFL